MIDKKEEICRTCQGSGIRKGAPCMRCYGKGRVLLTDATLVELSKVNNSTGNRKRQ